MKRGKKIVLILTAILLPGAYHAFAQTAEELLPQAIQLQEVKGELEEAINLYQLILDQYPEKEKICAKATLNMGICYEKLGSEHARQAYRDVIDKYAEQEDEVALARVRITRLDAYVADLNKQAEQHMQQGNELFKLWAYEEAIREYESALKLRPNTLLAMNAQYCIGQSWYRAGNYDEALVTFTNLIEENPNSTLAPVTELMISQVEYSMENSESLGIPKSESDGNTIVDPETGINYRKIKTFTGKNDVIEWTPGASLSPNGKFSLNNNLVVPLDGSDPFKYVDMQVSAALWSPDGLKIAFIVGDSSLFVIPVSPETGLATGPEENLISRDCSIYGINWSPDSKTLFYSILDYQNKPDFPEIWTITVLDGSTRPLTNDSTMGLFPSCSPDGSTVAFRDMLSIYLYSLNDGITNELIKKDRSFNPEWTPDGKWLYWDETRYSSSDMSFIRLSDKMEVKLNPPESTGSFLSFSPDGEKIYFYRSSYQLFWGMRVSSVTGGPSFEPVPHLPVYGAWWAKDSKMLIVQDDPAIKLVPISGGKSYQMDLDINAEGKPCHYDVSPDQKYLLFEIVKEDEKKDLYYAPISIEEARMAGPAVRIIENWSYTGGYNTQLSWSSDGKRLAFIHKGDIWIYNCDDKEMKQLTETAGYKAWIAWSPDGTMLSYQEFPKKPEYKQGSRIISSNDGSSIISIEDNLLWPYGWAPNSKSILYEDSNGKIVSHNILSGEISTIVDPNSKILSWIARYVWSPDGKYLLLDARKESEPDKHYLYKMSAEGGELTEIASDDLSFKYDISWSPDGKWICYCYMEMEKVRPESSLWEADYTEVIDKLTSGR